MSRYIALIDGEPGAYGVAIPDLPGAVAMGETIEAALADAAEHAGEWIASVTARGGLTPRPRTADALRAEPDVAEALRSEGAVLASVIVAPHAGRSVRANLSLDVGVLSALDEAAQRAGMTRSGLVEMMVRRRLHEVA